MQTFCKLTGWGLRLLITWFHREKRPIQLSGTQKNIWHKDFLFSSSLSVGLLPNISTQQEAVAHVSEQPSASDRIQKPPHFFFTLKASEDCSLHSLWGICFPCFLRWLSLLIFFSYQPTQMVSGHIVLNDKLTCSQGHIRKKQKVFSTSTYLHDPLAHHPK